MAMGKRRQRQEALFVMADGLPKSAGHPFYQRLNSLLAEADFDRWIEKRCQRYYEQEEKRGQPSIPPGVYFRMLLVGYFEGIDSQRGIAWRCADSLSLRQFLGIPLEETTPDPKTLSNTRRRLPGEVFDEVFQFVLRIAAEKKLLSGKAVGVDSTLLEAQREDQFRRLIVPRHAIRQRYARSAITPRMASTIVDGSGILATRKPNMTSLSDGLKMGMRNDDCMPGPRSLNAPPRAPRKNRIKASFH